MHKAVVFVSSLYYARFESVSTLGIDQREHSGKYIAKGPSRGLIFFLPDWQKGVRLIRGSGRELGHGIPQVGPGIDPRSVR